jgi:hypothetical protein
MVPHVLYDEMTIVFFEVVKHYWYSIVLSIFLAFLEVTEIVSYPPILARDVVMVLHPVKGVNIYTD